MAGELNLIRKGFHIFRRYRTFSRFHPVFKRSFDYLERRAIEDDLGDYSYGGLIKVSHEFSKEISRILDGKRQERVAFMCSNDANFLIVKWALWMSGQIAVPICCYHPTVALEYFLDDLDSSLLVAAPEHADRARELAAKTKTAIAIMDPELRQKALIKYLPSENCETPVMDTQDFAYLKEHEIGQDNNFYRKSDALIIYTSGSTGAPKGVIFSHMNLHSQVHGIAEAWKLNKRDCILQVLPNHRGQSPILGFAAPLSVGARIVLLKKNETEDIWLQLLGVRKKPETRINIFISYPQVFLDLIRVYEKLLKQSERMIDHIRTTCLTKVRLMSCGSGPISRNVYDKWEAYTGHQILERFGMAETGIVTATPLHGTRTYGTVGLPFPGVHVRLTSEKGEGLIAEGSSSGTRVLGVTQPVSGLLQVRSEGMFSGYWRKPTTTQEVLTRDGWFKTGDLVQYSRGVYKVIGRLSTDIIKSGSNLISTQHLEAVFRDHPDVKDAAVVGIKDLTKGEIQVVVAVKLQQGSTLGRDQLLSWLSENIPKYAVPVQIHFVDKMPRTWQGKADKDLVQSLFIGETKAHSSANERLQIKEAPKSK